MKFKCGKCGELNEIIPDNIPGDEFMFVACSYCRIKNKLTKPKKKPVVLPEEVVVTQQLAPEKINAFVGKMGYLEQPGWVFVHDENTQEQSFDLKPGKNIIGRKSSVSVDIPIKTNDEYMSRRHCMIEVIEKPGAGFKFLLSDFKALNGTFINGIAKKKLGTGDIFLLKDGDVIQLGMTKIVVRMNNGRTSREKARFEINSSGYEPTIIISKKKLIDEQGN